MTDSNQKSTVLVITEDIELISSLLERNTTNYEFISRETMQAALDEPDLLSNNHVVILDIDSVNDGVSGAIDQALNLKKSDPTQVLMLVGNPEPLGEILRSNIQPIIYRAFNKPISPNQIFLAFGSAGKLHESLIEKQAAGEDLLAIGPQENRTSVDSLVAQKKSKSAIYAAVGVLAVGVIAWLLLGNNSDTAETSSPVTTAAPTVVSDALVTSNDDVSEVNRLNQEAVKALLEGRRITPPNDSALYYYNQVLAIDPYDLSAYEGKKALVADLKTSYNDLVADADFETALETINALQTIEPLDTSNYELREQLEVAITEHVNNVKSTGTAEEVAEITTVLEKIGPQLQSTQTAAAALQNEKVLLESIDKALAENNLIPPQTGNAYAIVSEALQKNTISKVNFAPRLSALSEKLVESANTAIAEDKLEDAETLTALVKRLDVDPQNLALLEAKLEERKTAIAAEALETNDEEQSQSEATEDAVAEDEAVEEQEEETPVVAKIIPAKIISRSAPRYPSRALDRDIEGWVSIGFTIDTEGMPQDITVVESEPSGTFDNAAIAAVKKWRFSPAMNEQTQEPVVSKVDATKLQFKLGD